MSRGCKPANSFIDDIVTCRPREGGEKRAVVFNSREMAPAAASEEMFVNDTTDASTVGELTTKFC